jgi:hypothetical protein
MDPSFNINESYIADNVDIILGTPDADGLPLFAITNAGKNFIAWLQEYDDARPLGNWCCLSTLTDFDAYVFVTAKSRGLVFHRYQLINNRLITTPVTSSIL